MKKLVLCIGGLAAFAAGAAVTMSKVGEYDFSVNGCGGITYVGGNQFYILRDHDDASNKAEVYPAALTINASSGAIAGQNLGTPVNPGTLNDSEGLAFDPGAGTFWISDEASPTITEFYPYGMPTGRTAPIPAIQKSQKRGNRSLESLTISGDGLTMWAANEQALTCDGESSDGNTSVQTVVRLLKYTRPSLAGAWTAAGEWAYKCDACGGSTSAQSGLSGLCALPDGSLLALEREVSVSTTGRCRIYRVTPEALAAATEVSGLAALSSATYTAVDKGAKLLEFKGGGLSKMIVYEGICLGPRLSDGSLSVILVSDGGATKSALGGLVTATTVSRLCAIKLSGLDVRTLAFEAPAEGTASIVGSNFRYLAGASVENVLSGVDDSVPPGGAYTNLGEVAEWTSVAWAAPGQNPASGSGATARFTVAGDGTMRWTSESHALTNTTSTVYANDSFERPAAGTAVSELAGWTGDGEVKALTYAPAAAYPMAEETHRQVLEVDDAATRTYDAPAGNQRLEMMVCVMKAAEPLEDVGSDMQVSVAADETGRLCVWHRGASGNAWTPLSDRIWPDGTWVRVDLVFDYTSSADGVAYCQVSLDGAACATAAGVKSPKDPVGPGAWYATANGAAPARKVSSVSFSGGMKVDDLLLSLDPGASADPEPADTLNGIPAAWFDQYGFVRDAFEPSATIPGYTLGDVYWSGVNPLGSEPLAITAVRRNDDGTVELDFNACRADPELVYHVFRMADFSKPEEAVEVPSAAANFVGDAAAWKTTWRGDAGSSDRAFFFVKAVPVQ